MRTIFKKDQGFTLIELIIIISITGTLSLIVIPKIGNTLTNVKLKIVTGKLLDDVRYVQSYALTNHVYTWITINSGSNSYSYGYYNTAPNIDPQILIDPSNGQSANIDINDYSGVTITSESLGGGLDFDWFGIPDNGGQIILNNTKIVYVEDETGYVYEN
ncbi:MAG: prepilin-type N-terminal cleavage/methylation domain-containing protein [Candidatus Neomarinimicrobiota bacterium]